MTTLVENINSGVKVNKLFTQYLKIKTEKQFIKFTEKLKTVRFGTYKTVNLMEIIERFDKGNCNEIVRADFLRLVKKYN